ncbi:MAG: cytochrome c [Polyangiales bacterium]
MLPPARRSLALALALALGACRPASPAVVPDASTTQGPADPAASIAFAVDGRPLRSLTLGALAAAIPAEAVTTADPYYGRVKHFRALPLERVLAEGFAGLGGAPLATRQFVLRARDGYTVPIAGARLLEGGAYLAVRDVDAPGWEPIGPRRSDPSPAYLVWSGAAQSSLETHPRPWQLAAIEVARFEDAFPHAAPTGEPEGSPARLGFAVFGRECVRCHAVNREGGRVGPDLNVPQSVVEYRPEAQIRAYIRNPLTFRYGAMPPHPHLTEPELDGLLAYFRAMSTRKHDPDAARDAGGAP